MTDRKTSKFRVGIITVWEVEAADERDARRVAEGAVQFMVTDVTGHRKTGYPVVQWQHSNGHEYEATLLRGPAEVGAALRNQYMFLDVYQPTEND